MSSTFCGILTVFSSNYIYNDYDILNKELESKFEVKIPQKVEDKVFYTEGETRILNLKDTIKFIEETSSNNINDIKKAVFSGDKDWLEIRPLKRI